MFKTENIFIIINIGLLAIAFILAIFSLPQKEKEEEQETKEIIKKNRKRKNIIRIISIVLIVVVLCLSVFKEIIERDKEIEEGKNKIAENIKKEEEYKDIVRKSEQIIEKNNQIFSGVTESVEKLASLQEVAQSLNDSLEESNRSSLKILNNLMSERSKKLQSDSMRFAATLKRIESRGNYLYTTLNNVEENKVDRESLIKFTETILDILANESGNSIFKCNTTTYDLWKGFRFTIEEANRDLNLSDRSNRLVWDKMMMGFQLFIGEVSVIPIEINCN